MELSNQGVNMVRIFSSVYYNQNYSEGVLGLVLSPSQFAVFGGL